MCEWHGQTSWKLVPLLFVMFGRIQKSRFITTEIDSVLFSYLDEFFDSSGLHKNVHRHLKNVRCTTYKGIKK